VSPAHGTYAAYANRQDTGDATVHSTINKDSTPWSVQRYSKAVKVQTFSITFSTIFEGTESQNDDEFQCFLAQIHSFEKLDVECSPYFKGVKGRLAKHLEFWIKIEASDFVIDTIRNGDVIPILNPLYSMFMKNNKSALKKL
jgi:hypothetical protein